MGALAKLDALKTRLDIDIADTSQDTLLSGVLDGASRAIERHCRRVILYVDSDVTELHHGGGWTLHLKRWPITSIVSVKEASDYDFAAATALTADTDFRAVATRGDLVRLPIEARWLAGVETIQVVYRGGYTSPDDAPVGGVAVVPTHIQEACLLQGAVLLERRKDPGRKIPTQMPGGMSSGAVPDLELVKQARDLLIGERRMV